MAPLCLLLDRQFLIIQLPLIWFWHCQQTLMAWTLPCWWLASSPRGSLSSQGKDTYSAADWVDAFLDATVDWGLPLAFVSDQDKKFMSAFYKALFKKLNVSFLTSTAYHLQTDGQSEQINQTVEIALQYWLTSNPDADWVKYLPCLRSVLNNLASSSMTLSPNEVIYGYCLCDTLFSL